ncbi:MAG: D-glycerate dehydrogenase [Chloroflexi bacterium]|nr:D-glycerate dehydrogenase [Chloroflexota bacterium]
MKPRILVTQKVLDPALELLRSVGTVELNPNPDRILPREELIEAVRRNEYLFCLLTNKIDAEVMDANPGLRIIADMAVGYDNVDVKAATVRKIPVTNTPGVLTDTTADQAWALLMAVARRTVEADRFVRDGKWTAWGPLMMLGTDVHGKTIGIVGMGRIGQAVARRARGFGMTVLYHNRNRVDPALEAELGARHVSFEELLRESDFVSINCPYSPATHHLFSHQSFAAMKRAAFLVNASRGPIVDERALVAALQTGEIKGAGLDVFEREPAVEPELLEMGNVVLAPHLGSATYETRTKMALVAANNIVAVIRGERPPNVVNPEIYG